MAKKNHRTSGDKPATPTDKFLPIAIDTAANVHDIETAERVVIFSVDGVDYDMPKVERAELAVKFMQLQEEDADDAAQYLLLETIGQAGVDALAGVRGLKSAQFEGVMTRIQAIALPKGKRPKGANAKH